MEAVEKKWVEEGVVTSINIEYFVGKHILGFKLN